MSNDYRPVGWCCKRCLFSVVNQRGEDPKSNVCVRFPPSAYPTQMKHPITQQMVMATLNCHPPAEDDKWCGEFKGKLVKVGKGTSPTVTSLKPS